MSCLVCQAPNGSSLGMCSSCRRSYDRLRTRDDGTLLSIMRWAAKRARQVAKQRSKQKKGCPIDNTYCQEHDIVHGKEAEELRAGVEKLISMGYSSADDLQNDLQHLLDSIDARDSLAWREAKEGK